MAISGDGRRVASSSLDSVIIVWDTMSGAKVATMETGPVDAWSVIFTHDDKYIVSGSHTGNVNMFNIDTGANSGDDWGDYPCSKASWSTVWTARASSP